MEVGCAAFTTLSGVSNEKSNPNSSDPPARRLDDLGGVHSDNKAVRPRE